jgi:hypothetical protein
VRAGIATLSVRAVSVRAGSCAVFWSAIVRGDPNIHGHRQSGVAQARTHTLMTSTLSHEPVRCCPE